MPTLMLGTQAKPLFKHLSLFSHHQYSRSHVHTLSTPAFNGVSQNPEWPGHQHHRHGVPRWYSVPSMRQSTTPPTLSPEEFELLYHLTQQAQLRGPFRPPPPPPPLPTDANGPRSSSSSDLPVPPPWLDHRLLREHAARATLDPHQVFQSSQATAACLQSLVADAMRLGDLSQRAIADLPTTTFTELLRSVDPLSTTAGEQAGPAANPNLPLDLASGRRIGPGHALYSPLGQLSDIWGVRICHMLLFRRTVAAVQLRIQAGKTLGMADFKTLVRIAGATGDPLDVRHTWQLMYRLGLSRVRRDGESFTELTRARFMTEPLYMQWDRGRFRGRAIDLYRQKWLRREGEGFLEDLAPESVPLTDEDEYQSAGRWQNIRIRRLRTLAADMAGNRAVRYGQDRHVTDRASYLTRIMRQHRPAYRILASATSGPYAADEPLLSALVVALARSASFYSLQENILARVWGVHVKFASRRDVRLRSPSASVFVAQDGQEASGDPQDLSPPAADAIVNGLRRDSPLYPSERLLLAVAEAYGSWAEITLGLQIVDAISRRYGVSITDRVWSVLLEWTFIQASEMAYNEWRMAGSWPTKVIPGSAVEMVYNTMTAEPYCVRPTFEHNLLLAKSLVARRLLRKAKGRMLDDLMPAYREQLAEVERLYCRQALVRGLVQGESGNSRRRGAWLRSIRDPAADPTAAVSEWMAARIRGAAMRHAMTHLCHSFLKRVNNNNRFDDDWTLRGVPRLVHALREVMPRTVEYKILTGKVEIELAPRPDAYDAGVDAHDADSEADRVRESVGLRVRRHRRMKTRVWKPVLTTSDMGTRAHLARLDEADTATAATAPGSREAMKKTRKAAVSDENIFHHLFNREMPGGKWPPPAPERKQLRDPMQQRSVALARKLGLKWGRRRALIKAMRMGTVRWNVWAMKTWWARIDR